MGDTTGNIADLLNNLSGTNSNAINTFSSAVGAVADAAGGVSAVIAVVDTFNNLFNGYQDPLQPVLDALQEDFAQMYAALEANFYPTDVG